MQLLDSFLPSLMEFCLVHVQLSSQERMKETFIKILGHRADVVVQSVKLPFGIPAFHIRVLVWVLAPQCFCKYPGNVLWIQYTRAQVLTGETQMQFLASGFSLAYPSLL